LNSILFIDILKKGHPEILLYLTNLYLYAVFAHKVV